MTNRTKATKYANFFKFKKKSLKKSKLQYFRALCLFLMILFFLIIPYSNWYANNKIAYNLPHLVGLAETPLKGYLYGGFDAFYSLWEDPVRAATSNNGSLWAYTVLGVPISDPVGLISELINSVKLPVKYLIGGLIPFILSLLLGRFFCSWFCPMRVLYNISKKIKAVLKFLHIPLMEVKLEEKTRVFIFWGGLILSYFLGAWVWHFILPYIAFTQEIFSYIVFSTISIGFYFLISLIVLDIGLFPGQFCEKICPTGFLLSYIGKFSIFKIQADSKNCPSKCQVCNKVCPINLFPKEEKLYSCDLCMICVDNCPKKHIQIKVRPMYKNLLNNTQAKHTRQERSLQNEVHPN